MCAVGNRGDDGRELRLCLGRGPGDGEGGQPLVGRDGRPHLLDARASESFSLGDGRRRDPDGGEGRRLVHLSKLRVSRAQEEKTYALLRRGSTEHGGKCNGSDSEDRRELHFSGWSRGASSGSGEEQGLLKLGGRAVWG